MLKQPELADTLGEIAAQGEQYFYNSSFTVAMVDELAAQYDSILTVDDFREYEVVVREVLVSEYNGLQVHSAPPPASGAIVSLIMNIMEGKDWSAALTHLSLSQATISPVTVIGG